MVPSAPAGNASVYSGLTGPVFAVSDLAQSGDAAFATACDLIELGLASRMIAAGIAPRDAIVDRVLGPLHGADGDRGEGAGFALIAESASAPAGAPALVEVLGRYGGASLVELPAPSERALVVLGAADASTRGWLEQSAWAAVAVRDLVTEHRHHEALGSLALAVAVELLADNRAELALVLSGSSGKSSAVLLGRFA